MRVLKENDVFALSKPVEATTIGETDTVELPVGQIVSVVLVFGDPSTPVAYEVEAFLESRERYVLATVAASDVQ